MVIKVQIDFDLEAFPIKYRVNKEQGCFIYYGTHSHIPPIAI